MATNNQTSASQHGNSPHVQTESYQPTVRVMRLYKPGFHHTQTFPRLPPSFASSNICEEPSGADFTLSPYLLLPDSFGDIYAGEKFSAYIAVVNGHQNFPFHQVSLSVRLQTSTSVIDLSEHRLPGTTVQNGKALGFNSSLDIVVQHVLHELGIHTLRVSVQYFLSPNSEPKTLRKFYRFNVLQPLVLQSSYIEVNGRPMVQCEVTNATKSPIFIDEMMFVPSNKSWVCTAINPSSETKEGEVFAAEDLHILQNGESYAFAFQFLDSHHQHQPQQQQPPQQQQESLPQLPPQGLGKAIGHPVVRWCNCMGEYSVYSGEDTLPKGFSSARGGDDNVPTATASTVSTARITNDNSAINSNRSSTLAAALKPIRFHCLTPPGEVSVGRSFSITLRVFNLSNRPVSLHLDCQVQTLVANTASSVDVTRRQSRSGSFSRSRAASATTSNPTAGGGGGSGASGASFAGTVLAMHNTLLDSRANHLYGLCYTGLTYTPLDIIDAGDYTDTTLTLYALSAGLHELPPICFIDAVTKEIFVAAGLCTIFVSENEDEMEEEEEEDDDDDEEDDEDDVQQEEKVADVDVASERFPDATTNSSVVVPAGELGGAEVDSHYQQQEQQQQQQQENQEEEAEEEEQQQEQEQEQQQEQQQQQPQQQKKQEEEQQEEEQQQEQQEQEQEQQQVEEEQQHQQQKPQQHGDCFEIGTPGTGGASIMAAAATDAIENQELIDSISELLPGLTISDDQGTTGSISNSDSNTVVAVPPLPPTAVEEEEEELLE